MSYINFEKSSGKNYLTHAEIDEKLKQRDEQRKADAVNKRKEIFKSSLKLDNQWMLPSLSAQLDGKPHKKKRKKERRRSSSSSDADMKKRKSKKKKRKKSRRKSSSSDSEDSRSDNQGRSLSCSKKKSHRKEKRRSESSDSSGSDLNSSIATKKENPAKRDDWMNIEALVPTVERVKKENPQKNVNKCIVAQPGQTSRELNPYWKDGGTGLPGLPVTSEKLSGSVRGLEWYQRGLKRAQEQAAEEGRSLEDVVSERWGSLEALKSLIAQAELTASPRSRSRRDHRGHADRTQSPEDSSKRPLFWRPGDDKVGIQRHERDDRRRENWRKDKYKRSDKPEPSTSRYTSKSRDISFSPLRSSHGIELDHSQPSASKDFATIESKSASFVEKANEERKDPNEKKDIAIPSILTDEQLNTLAAKLVKAEIMGNDAQIAKLKAKLAGARTAREQAAAEASSSKNIVEETVVLVETNSKGLMRPVSNPGRREPSGGRRKNQKAETHRDGKRVRYFADDDNRDIKEMFEREKLSTADDDKRMFMNLASKKGVKHSSDEDADFEHVARIKEKDKSFDKAVNNSAKNRKIMEGCRWCLENKARAKHLVVSIGETCYLCLPAEESLTPLHCLIVPIEHVTCGTLLDENVWEEVHQFRRALMKMAEVEDSDMIVFEQARGLSSHPHMVQQCVILEKEAGDMAPIYFKKAILESESEWSNNKKLVEIKGSDVRRCVPKGLPYFSVEFGTSGGFAHVIEDENQFSRNFAQEIIGGMMDLDHRKWRKASKTSFAEQREKTVAFARKWAKYDFTAKKKKAHDSDSDSTSSSSSAQSGGS